MVFTSDTTSIGSRTQLGSRNMANLPSDELPSKFDVVVDGTGECLSLMRNLLYRATVVDSTKLLHRPFLRIIMLERPLGSTRPCHLTMPSVSHGTNHGCQSNEYLDSCC